MENKMEKRYGLPTAISMTQSMAFFSAPDA